MKPWLSLIRASLCRLLLEDERMARRNALAKRLATKAKFRTQCDLTNWDMSFNRSISKAKLKDLAIGNFYYKRQNLILEGKTGVGKTHLAIGLGRMLCENEVSVSFFSTNLLFEQVAAEKSAGKLLNFIQRLRRTTVLILDDFGLHEYTHEEAGFLLEILEDRYGKGIVIVTSQVSPNGWRTLFKDPIIADALVDRFLNPSDIVELTGFLQKAKTNKLTHFRYVGMK